MNERHKSNGSKQKNCAAVAQVEQIVINKGIKSYLKKILFYFGFKGKKCKCGFYEISHTYPELEFDLEYYPCNIEFDL